MPPKGWKSISVPEDIYDYFKNRWEERKFEYRKRGVTSFSGFVSKLLSEMIEREEKRTER